MYSGIQCFEYMPDVQVAGQPARQAILRVDHKRDGQESLPEGCLCPVKHRYRHDVETGSATIADPSSDAIALFHACHLGTNA